MYFLVFVQDVIRKIKTFPLRLRVTSQSNVAKYIFSENDKTPVLPQGSQTF